MDQSRNLHWVWRLFIGLVGAGALVLGGLTWQRPPKRDVAPPAGAIACTVLSVSADPTAISLALLATGVMLCLVSANGRRLSGLKLPGGVEIVAEVAAAKEVLEKKADSLDKIEPGGQEGGAPAAPPARATVTIKNKLYGVYTLSETPWRVVKDLVGGMSEQGMDRAPFDVEFVARKSGRGNHAWIVQFRGKQEAIVVSYGGQGKAGATVAEL